MEKGEEEKILGAKPDLLKRVSVTVSEPVSAPVPKEH